ncbi:TonB-dependent receptor [Sphingomonas ginsenosidivorax]|uniref:TonB-dependent receptor n=1 Tax=Sphingomonas ginsenosidivorax TaxID=862135 RepID=A0A5C6UF46_9SPHN|nr:TonB-dependent receptor [Sphingomonas ginsenosidivorax]
MKLVSYFCTASALALTTVPAFAQEQSTGQTAAGQTAAGQTATGQAAAGQAPTTDPTDAQDIIVTANRTESLLSKTPVAISAITGDGLRAAGITNPTALADQVPNISIDRNSGGVQVTIRGVTSTDVSERGDPSAAFLADGVYIARPQAQEVSFFDVARVEVLRGPQGTLYGRNTTAGLINVISNRPTFDRFGGSVDVGYGNYDACQASAAVNLPVSQNLAFRVAGNFDQRDTFTRFGPQVTGRSDPFRKNLSGRVSGLYKWNSGNLLLRGDYSDIGGHVFDLLPIRNFYADTPTGIDPIRLKRSRRAYMTENANIGWDLYRRNYSWGIGGELTQDVGPITVSYVGSYRRFKRDEEDARISPDAALAYHYSYDGHYRQQSHELRLATNGGGPLTLQGGGYFFKEDSDIVLKGLIGTANPGRTGDGTTLAFFQDPTKAKSYAFFGQGTYALTDSLRFTAGARYSHDDKSRVGYTVTCASFFTCARPANAVPNNNASATFAKTTWRLGLDYDLTPTTLLYGTVSTGYKAGGFNDGCERGTGTGCTLTADALYYDPETLTSYEAGIKTRFLDNAVRLDASAFHYDYNNLQLS